VLNKFARAVSVVSTTRASRDRARAVLRSLAEGDQERAASTSTTRTRPRAPAWSRAARATSTRAWTGWRGTSAIPGRDEGRGQRARTSARTCRASTAASRTGTR
jgi:hypothetical protein